MVLLPGFALPPSHPLAGREAYQCDVCRGISYPADPSFCPYCAKAALEEES